MAMSLLLAAVICCLQPFTADADAVGSSWNYDQGDPAGPENWRIQFPSCGGTMQSPINIKTTEAVYDPKLQPLDFSDYGNTQNVHLKLVNIDGHAAEVIVSGREIFLKGGSFQAPLILTQFHFHWGMNASRGSEHSINGKFAPLEVHFVHVVKADVGSTEPLQFSVVSFLYKIGRANKNYDPIIRNLDDITNPNDETEIPTFSLKTLLPSKLDYYRYMGSLTTPPCSEQVTWTVVAEPIEISLDQLNKFKSLYDEKHHLLVKDYRPVQPLNQRTVSTTKKPKSDNN